MTAASIFYDSSCFPTISEEGIKTLLKGNENFFISPVLEEIRQGYRTRSTAREFSYVLDRKGHLRKGLHEISLDNCFKLAGDPFKKGALMHLKRNPVLCSAYYTWIISAKNPAVIHDTYRHLFNGLLFSAAKGGPELEKISEAEAAIRVRETQWLEKHDAITGRNLKVKRPWLLKARRKRMDDVKQAITPLTDYQLITSAFLYSAWHGTNVMVVTADRDLVDIQDNLYRSIIERYAINEYLMSYFGSRFIKPPVLEITFEEIEQQVLKVLERIANESRYIMISLQLYRPDFQLLFPYPIRIPVWMRDFILQYKKTLDCMSLPVEYDQLYPVRYTMEPDFDRKVVTYRTFPRISPPGKTCQMRCFDSCKYVQIEKDDPSRLSDFM